MRILNYYQTVNQRRITGSRALCMLPEYCRKLRGYRGCDVHEGLNSEYLVVQGVAVAERVKVRNSYIDAFLDGENTGNCPYFQIYHYHGRPRQALANGLELLAGGAA